MMPAPPPQAFRCWTQEKLRNADTDQFHHVNNAVMASFFEAGRMEIFSPDEARPLMEGANLAVVRLVIDFHRELFYPGDVRIGSIIKRIGNSSFEVAQALYSSDICIASAEATCVLFDPARGRAQPISARLRGYLNDRSI